jgi:hypothetical protein
MQMYTIRRIHVPWKGARVSKRYSGISETTKAGDSNGRENLEAQCSRARSWRK